MQLAHLIMQHLAGSTCLNPQQSSWLHGQMQSFAQNASLNDFARLHSQLQGSLHPHLLPHVTDVFARYAPARAGGWHTAPYMPMPQAPNNATYGQRFAGTSMMGAGGLGAGIGGMGGLGLGLGGLNAGGGTQMFSDGFGDSTVIERDGFGDTTIIERDAFGDTDVITRDAFGDSTSVQTDAFGDRTVTRTDAFGDTTTTTTDAFGDSQTTTNDGFGFGSGW